MLDHLGARLRRHQRRHGGDVDGVELVPAGAHDVELLAGNVYGLRVGKHGVDQAGELLHGLALGAEGNEESGDLGGRRLPGHDGVHGPRRVVRGEVRTV